MICPQCGTVAHVIETRNGDTTVVIRTRYCEQNHVFQTLETPIHNTVALRVKKRGKATHLPTTVG